MIFRKNSLLIFFFLTTSMFFLSAFVKKHTATFSSNTIHFIDTVPPKDTQVFETVEQEAYFPGGEAGWRQYLEQNLNANVPVDKGAPAGTYTVLIQFIVDVDGKLSDIKTLTHFGYGLEAEVLRIIRKSPPWIPAVQHGRNVKAYRKQPITFRVVDDRKKKRRDRE